MRQVRIINVSRQTLLVERAHVADRFAARLRGLIGRPPLRAETGLVLVPAAAVHSFFLRFPIDVVHVDHDGRVLRTRAPLAPGGLSLARGGRYAVELPAGTVRRTGTGAGDYLRFEAIDETADARG